ncbi:MAG: hypothetical protein RLN70_12050, partial [Rhodospirillaceae bacterium]
MDDSTDNGSGQPQASDLPDHFGAGAIRRAMLGAEEWTSVDESCARLERNDKGNGERLARRFGNRLIFVKGVGWHRWSKKHWEPDPHGLSALACAH